MITSKLQDLPFFVTIFTTKNKLRSIKTYVCKSSSKRPSKRTKNCICKLQLRLHLLLPNETASTAASFILSTESYSSPQSVPISFLEQVILCCTVACCWSLIVSTTTQSANPSHRTEELPGRSCLSWTPSFSKVEGRKDQTTKNTLSIFIYCDETASRSDYPEKCSRLCFQLTVQQRFHVKSAGRNRTKDEVWTNSAFYSIFKKSWTDVRQDALLVSTRHFLTILTWFWPFLLGSYWFDVESLFSKNSETLKVERPISWKNISRFQIYKFPGNSRVSNAYILFTFWRFL